MKEYNGNRKPFLCAAFAENDRKAAVEVLEQLEDHGVMVCTASMKSLSRIRKASGLIVFLSRASLEDDTVLAAVDLADREKKPILSIHLEEITLSPGLSMILGEIQGILKYRETEESFRDKLLSSPVVSGRTITKQQKSAYRRSVLVISILILLLTSLTGVFLYFSSVKTISPDSPLGKLGLKGSLDSIREVYLYGEQLKEEYDTAVGFYLSESCSYIMLGAEKIPTGNLTDLTAFADLKNLRFLCVHGNEIREITPILGLEKLEMLDLSGNHNLNIDGISSLKNLRTLNLADTDIDDLSELLLLPSLETLYVSGGGWDLATSIPGRRFEVICVDTLVTNYLELKRALEDPETRSIYFRDSLTIPEGETLTVPAHILMLGAAAPGQEDLKIVNNGTVLLYGGWENGLLVRENNGTIVIESGGLYSGGMCDTVNRGTFRIEEGGQMYLERGHLVVSESGLFENRGFVQIWMGGQLIVRGGSFRNAGEIVFLTGSEFSSFEVRCDNRENTGHLFGSDLTGARTEVSLDEVIPQDS